jgi:predicted HD phosphohydrolase
MYVLTQDELEYVFSLIERLEGLADNPKYHPEKDVFNHTCQVVKHAFRESEDRHLIMAALLHDIGKYKDSHKHPEIGCDLLRDMNTGLLSFQTADLVRDHRLVQLYLDGDLKKLKKVKEFLANPNFRDLMQLRRWDIMGRKKHNFPNWDILKDRITKLAFGKVWI